MPRTRIGIQASRRPAAPSRAAGCSSRRFSAAATGTNSAGAQTVEASCMPAAIITQIAAATVAVQPSQIQAV